MGLIDLRNKEDEYVVMTCDTNNRKRDTICTMCDEIIYGSFPALIRTHKSTLTKNHLLHSKCYEFALKGQSMVICIDCKKEMQCIEMGISARWSGTHAYPGDIFQCPTCGHKMLKCNTSPVFSDNLKENDIYMDGTFRDYVPKNFNLRE